MPAESHPTPSAATVVPRAVILALALAGFLALGGGQALASHVSCGDTITTDTKLDSDLANCPNDGVVIGAGDITLDLDSHTIDGDGVDLFSTGVGSGFDNVEVKGPGVIREFAVSVFIATGSSGSVVHGLTVFPSPRGEDELREGGIILNGDDGRVQDNTVTGPGIGIGAAGSGIHVENNVVSDNRFIGVELHCDGCVVRHNTLFGNGGGLLLNGGTGNRVERNSVFLNDGVGIYLSLSETGVPGDHNRVEHNSVFENETGIGIEASNDNVVRNNSTYDNVIGIGVVFANDNTVESNSASGNAEDGISVSNEFGESTGTLIERNLANDNGDDGIDIDSPATTLTKNTANDNGDLGIEAVPRVSDGGGNKAKGNGNLAQCLNVACK